MPCAIWATANYAWPIKFIPPKVRQVQPLDISTLLVGGSMDFSNPAQFATQGLLPFLKNVRQIILHEFGHVNDAFSLRPEAIERLLVSFFNAAEADDSLFTYTPMNFCISLGLSMLAKAILGMAALLLLVLLVLMALLAIKKGKPPNLWVKPIVGDTTGKIGLSLSGRSVLISR